MVSHSRSSDTERTIVRSYIFSDLTAIVAVIYVLALVLWDRIGIGDIALAIFFCVYMIIIVASILLCKPKIVGHQLFKKVDVKMGILPIVYNLDFSSKHEMQMNQTLFVSHMYSFCSRNYKYINIPGYGMRNLLAKSSLFSRRPERAEIN